MDNLITTMMNPEPALRPTMKQVVTDFQTIVSKLPFWRLRSRLIVRKDGVSKNFVKDVYHIFYRTPTHLLRLRKAIPRPQDPKS